ncbi:MAG: VCBS repeat-containing protein, partial [Planctomycetes bacterium]|nr:VCBS repeat-containing protein [Planctomycetota bacterium]
MLNRFGFAFFGIGAIILGVNSAFLPEVNADCSTLFGPDVPYGAGSGPLAVAVGDLNGDGDADLAVANSGVFGGGDNVSVLLNNGDGTFADDVLYE